MFHQAPFEAGGLRRASGLALLGEPSKNPKALRAVVESGPTLVVRLSPTCCKIADAAVESGVPGTYDETETANELGRSSPVAE